MEPSSLLARLLERRADPSPLALSGGGSASYADVVSRAEEVARWLLARSGGPLAERRVALLAEPSPDFLVGFFAILLAGGVVVVLSPLHPHAERELFCEDARVSVVFTDAHHRDGADALGRTDRAVVALDEARTASATELPPVAAGDAALQLYTSGTTGRPKGAVLTHENLGVQQALLVEAWGWTPTDRLLHALPLHHMHGLAIALLPAIAAGASVRLMPFDARALWEAMGDASVFMAVPTMYHRLFEAFDAADDAARERWAGHARALRLATSGSAALPVPLADRWRSLTGTIPLERFGMTEIGVGLSNSLSGERFRGAVGRPLPTVEARVVDDSGVDATTGELWVRGPSVFRGYFGRPEADREAFVPARDGGRPWFRTGDTVARDDATGVFRVLGRTSVDILKSGGYKLSALEIEDALRGHDAVEDVAVVGIGDERWGDRVVACVVTRRAVDGEELRTFLRALLAPYKIPKQVVFRESLPRNALGKVIKPQLVRELSVTSSSSD